MTDNTLKNPSSGSYTDIDTAQGCIRHAMNERILSMADCVKGASDYISAKTAQYSIQNICLQALDNGLSKLLSEAIAGQLNVEKYSHLPPYPELLRTYRDLLFDTATRQDRIVAGIKQTLRKGRTNKRKDKAFL